LRVDPHYVAFIDLISVCTRWFFILGRLLVSGNAAGALVVLSFIGLLSPNLTVVFAYGAPPELGREH